MRAYMGVALRLLQRMVPRAARMAAWCAVVAGGAAGYAQPHAAEREAPPSGVNAPSEVPARGGASAPSLPPSTHVAALLPVAPVNLPLAVDSSSRLTLPVHIGGRGPFHFVVDTGAERTVVSTELAQQLNLPPMGTMRVVALTGAVSTPTVAPGPLSLAHLTLETRRVPTFAAADLGAQGLIGIDSLQNQRLIIDFVNGTMDVREAVRDRRRVPREFDRDAIVVVARRKDGRLILSDATIGGRRVNVVIDTGAQATIGNRALQRMVAAQRLQRHRALAPGELRSVTGDVMAVERTLISHIAINGVDFTDLPIAYGDSPAFAALGLDRRPALLLGMDAFRLFDRVAIDFANRRVVFDLPDGAQLPVRARLAGLDTHTGG